MIQAKWNSCGFRVTSGLSPQRLINVCYFLKCTAFGSNFNMAHPELNWASMKKHDRPCNQFIHQLKPWQTEVSQTEWINKLMQQLFHETHLFTETLPAKSLMIKINSKKMLLYSTFFPKYEVWLKPNLDSSLKSYSSFSCNW
jgi:hypothetical protein